MKFREGYSIIKDILRRLKKHWFSSNKSYWFDIIKKNSDDLVRKGFKINDVGELGVQVYLTNEEVKDLDYMSDKATRDLASYKIFRLKLAEFLNRNEQFFLSTGILELIAMEDYTVEKSIDDEFTYHVYITYSFGRYNKKFWILLFISLSLTFCLITFHKFI